MNVLLHCSSILLLAGIGAARLQAAAISAENPHWTEVLRSAREQLALQNLREDQQGEAAQKAWFAFKDSFPTQWDWTLQDGGEEFWRWFLPGRDAGLEQKIILKAGRELADLSPPLQQRLDALIRSHAPAGDPRWLKLYADGCEQRRELRLRTVLKAAPRIVFIKHRTLRPSFFAYTEGQSDAQNERHFLPGSELCLLEFSASTLGKVRTLVADPTGAIRDPAVSWDGQRVVFAWKKSLDEDDYHLYECEVSSGRIRQLTSGLGFADYEPAFLPDGDLIFASTRCVQTVDCWWTEVSNLYRCDPDGHFLRRLSFDQVHAIYPQVLDDGRVVYTRWDYNDRGQIFPQPLFQMNSDGTGQGEFYGNSSWFPTTIAHARGIPGTQKVLAILCGHHSSQAGKLAVIDPALGRQENSGVQLVAPIRPTPAERIDSYGQDGELWQYPYPLNERECLVGFAPLGWDRPDYRRGDADFGIYWMDLDGRRELLAWDRALPCSQPVPLVSRPPVHTRASQVDYCQSRGTYYLKDVYAGNGLRGIKRGTIKKLRVVALSFRAAGIGYNGSTGPGGGALVSTPVAIGNGSWDVKTVLGEATVYEDGSACFTVPARTPVYFQALDGRGYAVQTMRSWSTLQPGEILGCAGCHELQKSTTPPARTGYTLSLALQAGPERIGTSGQAQGFSFPKRIQPILDRHCIRCHKDRSGLQWQARGLTPVLTSRASLRASRPSSGNDENAFTLLGTENPDPIAKRKWSDAYLVLTQARPDRNEETKGAFQGNPSGRVVNWISSQSVPEPLPPISGGATRSGLLELLRNEHKNVKLSPEEFAEIACWIDLLVPYCGDYLEANAWTDDELKKYEHYAAKRRQMESLEQESLKNLTSSAAQ